MGCFDQVLAFQGTWRKYQQRILDKSYTHLKDNRIHIVAAPGSGKTTLGIECIRRIDNPTLVLVPSIAIREQWVNRIVHGFMCDDVKVDDYVSTSLSNIKPITIVTYQAIHSAMSQYQGKLVDEEVTDEVEQVDFSGFNLLEALQQHHIKTICLDEAHHLRSEWWKALEQVVASLPSDHVTISLTATPPYDSTIQEWERYISLCGEIDEEIFTPELVQEGSLCPHQDYIYFSLPTKDEQATISSQKQNIEKVVQVFLNDETFKKTIQTHIGLHDYKNYEFLENPKYFTSYLILMRKLNISYPKYLDQLLGKRIKLPHFDYIYFETFLQGFLYEDSASYQLPKEEHRRYVHLLKEANCHVRNKVILNIDTIYAKQLTTSASKITSIQHIVSAEYKNLKDELRLLVLCDYIKKEHKTIINTKTPIVQMGTIPVFESLRRTVSNDVKLAVLSGSIVILPTCCLQALQEQIPACNIQITKLAVSDYVEVTIKGMKHRCVEVVTSLFEQGHFQVLISTKSLLGEGWDSPCINSMILATFVGSFMLSNQMRGRAIRKDPNNPNKVSNIWHLVCAQYPSNDSLSSTNGISEDYTNLERRFKTFLGLHYTLDQIESGSDRITTIIQPFNELNVARMNEETLALASNRNQLQEHWKQTLETVDPNFEINEVIELKRQSLLTSFSFLDIITVSTLLTILNIIIYTLLRGAEAIIKRGLWKQGFIIFLIAILLNVLFINCFWYLYKKFSPQKKFKKLANALHALLVDTNQITSQSKVMIKENDTYEIVITLENASIKEQTIFIKCIKEMFSEIDNQRYFIMQSWFSSNYFAVPERYSKRKDDATSFLGYVSKVIGKFRLVYSRNPEGRTLLLRARTKSFINKNNRILSDKKKVKSKFE